MPMLCAVYLVMHLPFDTSQTLQTCTDHVREKASDKILDDEYWLVLDFFSTYGSANHPFKYLLLVQLVGLCCL